MYFVVFLHKLNKNVVVPSTWIRGMNNDQMEKFVRMSLNRSQRFLCYYTSNEAAFEQNMCPKIDFHPDFQSIALVDTINNGEFDGGFIAQLLAFRCKYYFV